MADQPTTPSGSRWEPDPDGTPGSPAAEFEPGQAPVEPLDDPTSDQGRHTLLRQRAVIAGTATALVLGGGLAGFVIGHSTAGNSNDGFSPANFRQDQFGEGQQRPPGFGDRNGQDGPGNGDQGFGQQPPDPGSGSGSGTTGSGTPGKPT